MKLSNLMKVFSILITLFSAFNVPADDSTPAQAINTSEKTLKQATFLVPDLDEAMVGRISKGIAEHPGLVSVKPDLEKKLLAVVFDSGKTESDKIMKSIAAIAPDAKLGGVTDVPKDAAATKCGGCPNRAKCEKPKSE